MHAGATRQMAYKGRRGVPVEPATVLQVEGRGCFCLRASSHEIVAGPQAQPEAFIRLIKKDSTKTRLRSARGRLWCSRDATATDSQGRGVAGRTPDLARCLGSCQEDAGRCAQGDSREAFPVRRTIMLVGVGGEEEVD
jgi:hypothetical protein